MKKTNWDDSLRRRAQKEAWALTPEAEARFRSAAARARRENAQPKPDKRRFRTFVWVTAAECALALLLILWPARDAVRGPLPTVTESPAMHPVTQGQQALSPRVRLDATLLEGGEARVEGSFANETGEIWLIEWRSEREDGTSDSHLLWLEPGASCTDAMSWGTAQADSTLRWSYRGYRVTAAVLHWLDGERLAPRDADYADQQELLEAAFEADALILSPGVWPNGQAGEMTLLLPDAYLAAHPQESPLDYYLRKGMVQDASDLCRGEGSVACCAQEGA